jgi:PmbA protein
MVTTTGLRATDAVTDAYGKVIARDEDGRSGFAAGASVRASDIDLGALTRDAASKAPRGDLDVLAPGQYPVVLGAEAVGELLGFLSALAFDGQAHEEGRGALSGRLGTRVAAPSITLTDAPHAPGTLPRAFDGDGIPKTALTLIEDGVARSVTHDTVSAARFGTTTTGHAQPIGDTPYGPSPANLVLAAGDAADVDALAAPIERGVYVHRFWYTNPVEPKETLLTGVTRDGTHLIEDGRITRAIRDVRFTDTILGILSRVEALGARQQLVSAAEFYDRRFATGVVCPPLRASSLRITG